MTSTTSAHVEEVNEDIPFGANFGYVLAKLAQARQNNNEGKITKWEDFIKNMGGITVGSRTPVAGTPAWVTLEVAAGGFSTGNYMAGGELKEHEIELYKFFFNEKVGKVEDVRERLNNEMLTPRGLEILSEMLDSQLYDIKVPEEGALLVFTYLLQTQKQEEANLVLQEIKPFFGKLRFYPVPTNKPQTLGVEVAVESVGGVIYTLNNVTTHHRALRNRAICKDVIPSYDKLVRAVLLSSSGSNPPHVVKDGDKETISGDLPFQVKTEEVKAEVKAAVTELESYDTQIKNGQLFKKRNLGILLELAKKFLNSTATDRNCEVARKILATYTNKRGLPGSDQNKEARAKQAKSVAKIGVVDDFARVLAKRLVPYSSLTGLDNVKEVLGPIQMQEVQGLLEVGDVIPSSLQDKVSRAKLAPVDQLCDEGLVPSSEVLANLCPVLVASVQASGYHDRTVATLYGAIYRAFKNRRSLLLLNLASQVRIEELPWVSALQKLAKGKQDHSQASKATLEDVVVMSLTHWPETMMPNKLVGVLQDLSSSALRSSSSSSPSPSSSSRSSWPLLKELAADIFCFQFSQSFLTNAKVAAEQLKGTLYEKYYNLDYEKISKFTTTRELDEMCVKSKTWGNVAENGTAIERCMIITTHNLALLYDELDLKSRLAPIVPSLVRKIFNFIVKTTSNLVHMDWKTRLQILKNAAFAWRQMVFFLTKMTKEEVDEFFVWVFTKCDAIKDQAFKGRIELPVKYLHAQWTGKEENTCIFKGWVARGEIHFLMPPPIVSKSTQL